MINNMITLKTLNNEINVDYKYVKISGLIADMLEDNNDSVIPIPFCSKYIDKIIEFCKYYYYNETGTIEKYDRWYDEYFNIPIDDVFTICKIADFLDIEPLLNLTIIEIASILNTVSVIVE